MPTRAVRDRHPGALTENVQLIVRMPNMALSYCAGPFKGAGAHVLNMHKSFATTNRPESGVAHILRDAEHAISLPCILALVVAIVRIVVIVVVAGRAVPFLATYSTDNTSNDGQNDNDCVNS